MTKKTILKWRLGKLPTVEEIQSLIKDKIITQEEAREILFSQDEIEDRDKKSLEDEIKFLRDLIDKLSNRTSIIENIKYIEPNYKLRPWYKEYYYWTINDSSNSYNCGTSVNCNFSDIKTF